MEWKGQPRKVLVRPERNGYLYVIDRTTGEVLSAEPFGAINSTKGVDLKTGRLDPIPTRSRRRARSCATSARPRPARRTGSRRRSRRTPGSSTSRTTISAWTGKASRRTTSPARPMSARRAHEPGPGGTSGEFTAWDVAARQASAGRSTRTFRSGAARVATAGDVVFYGTMEGWFKAVSARTGELLWQFKTASGIIGQPVTYRGPDGQAICRHPLRRRRLGGRDRLRRSRPARWHGRARLRQRHDGSEGRHHDQGGTLYVFALP